MSRLINSAGLALIKEYEGLKLEAYICPAGVPTLGYGHTSGVHMGQTCSQYQADAWLEVDLVDAEEVVGLAVKVRLTDNQFAALVSFVFNFGAPKFLKSTLLQKLNAGEYEAVPAELRKWVNAGGHPQPGLVRRRNAEAALWSM